MCEIRNELGNLITGIVDLYSPSTENDYYFINGICDDDVELTDDLYVYAYNPIYANEYCLVNNENNFLASDIKTFFTIDFNKSTNNKIVLLSANVTIKIDCAISSKLINNYFVRKNGILDQREGYILSVSATTLRGGQGYIIVIPNTVIPSLVSTLFNCNIIKDNQILDTLRGNRITIGNKSYLYYEVDLSEYSENDIFTIQYTINALSKEQSLEVHNDTGYIFYLYNSTDWQNRAGFISKLRQRYSTTKGGIL